MKKLLLLPLAFAVTLSTAGAADLQVTVEGLDGGQGTLYFGLFDKGGFPNAGQQIAGAISKADQPRAIFKNLAAGDYAVSIYLDANDNGKLDRNLAGSPLEPYGFSNNAVGIMAPPVFESAAITLGADDQAIVIKLRK